MQPAHISLWLHPIADRALTIPLILVEGSFLPTRKMLCDIKRQAEGRDLAVG